MRSYLVKRILLFIPSLFIISLLAFLISVNAPGDPVERMVITSHESGEQNADGSNFEVQKKFWNSKLGLNLPLFYFEISDWASPDTLYKISDKTERECIKRLLAISGNWNAVSTYSSSLQKFTSLIQFIQLDSALIAKSNPQEIKTACIELQSASRSLKYAYEKQGIEFQFLVIEANLSYLNLSSKLSSNFNDLKHCYYNLLENKTTWKNYIPAMHFFPQNQYHRWLFGDGNIWTGANSQFSKGILRGDFGTSFSTKSPVKDKLGSRIAISLFFSLLSIVLAFFISIPIALKAARNPHGAFDNWSSLSLFLLYALPSFFVATLLLMTFANPDVLNWFPASGLSPAKGIPEGAGILLKFKIHLSHILLPLICFTYSSLAFISRSLRSSLLENQEQDYIRTARAKGLSEKGILYKHSLKNALLPMITLFSNVFPYALGGSVLLESIFTLPGMGLETFTAIQNQDYPVIVAIFTLSGCMTLLGTLLADMLYAFIDPRISFSKINEYSS